MILLLAALMAPPIFPDHKLTIEVWAEKTLTGKPGWTARLLDSPICTANALTQPDACKLVCQQAVQLGFSLNGGLLGRIDIQGYKLVLLEKRPVRFIEVWADDTQLGPPGVAARLVGSNVIKDIQPTEAEVLNSILRLCRGMELPSEARDYRVIRLKSKPWEKSP